MIARYLKYGNDCLLYKTIILEDNLIITIDRSKGGWVNNDKPQVTTATYDTWFAAKTVFKQLCKKFEKEYTKI